MEIFSDLYYINKQITIMNDSVKFSFNNTNYEFQYYEPKGIPAYNIQKDGEVTKFNLIWDDGFGNEVFSGFNLFEEIRYEHCIVSIMKLKTPFDISDIGQIFSEIKSKRGITL